jgi:N-acetylneuraminate synthase
MPGTNNTNNLGLRPDGKCFIIGEVGQTHDGSLGLAHSFIDAIANAGADAVKFQTHIADAESTPGEPWRVKFSYQDETRFDYWKRMEFTEPQWAGLKKHADEKGLKFLSTPFSFEAVELLQRTGVPAWKVGSGETNNTPMLRMMAGTGKPVLLSTGMSSLDEIDRSVAVVREAGAPVAVLQCTTAYPCPPERVGVNVLPEFRKRFDCPVGLSDHSGTIYPALAAAVLGASVIEVHVALTREQFGPDVPASVTTTELRQLVEGVRFIETMMDNPVNKDEAVTRMGELRDTFTKSLYTIRAMQPGETITAADLTVKKPGTGIPAAEFDSIVGRKVKAPVAASHMLAKSDLA